MDVKRMIRNEALVDVYYDENGEEILEHWVRIPACSGRSPFPKTNISNNSTHENAHGE